MVGAEAVSRLCTAWTIRERSNLRTVTVARSSRGFGSFLVGDDWWWTRVDPATRQPYFEHAATGHVQWSDPRDGAAPAAGAVATTRGEGDDDDDGVDI